VVTFFHQERTAAGDQAMQELTRSLIDEAIVFGGSYYLPYRLHATPDQLHRAYPSVDNFLRDKRRLDPDTLFRNEWWRRYGG
jgi:hypothetical protein